MPLCGIEWNVHIYTYMGLCMSCGYMCMSGHMYGSCVTYGVFACLRISVRMYGLQCVYVRMDKPSPREIRVRLVGQ